MPSREELIGPMLEHPDLIKRPAIQNGNKVSYDPDAIDEVVHWPWCGSTHMLGESQVQPAICTGRRQAFGQLSDGSGGGR